MKKTAPKNRTIFLKKEEIGELEKAIRFLSESMSLDEILNQVICQDMEKSCEFLPGQFVDMLFLDPPYNLNKAFNGNKFKKGSQEQYAAMLEGWLKPLLPLLKPTASVYICSDWNACGDIQSVAEKYFVVRNRITWEREKGRAAKSNWKNCSEDIWFCTMSDEYTFNVDAVKLKRKVIAPYKNVNGDPKGWELYDEGGFRLTAPSNLWTDITVPFWSMPENTEHPTQKPEKLLAKLILASTNPNDIILDPFAGSGTSAVVAKKLGRNVIAIERDKKFCLLIRKRMLMANKDNSIQGYVNNIFWERNTIPNGNGYKKY